MKAIEALRQRIMLLVGSGRVSLSDDSKGTQEVQVSAQGTGVHDRVPRIAEYGFTSVPPVGSEVVMVKLAGDHSQAVVVATGHQASRPKAMPIGATAIYDTAEAMVLLGADGTLTMSTPDASIAISGDRIDINAPGGLWINGHRYDTHQHTGVQTGSGTSGGVA